MKQFGEQFINYHLMPLMQQMLEDAAKADAGENPSKAYLSKLFVAKKVELSGADLAQMETDYFGTEKKAAGVPFIGEEEAKDRKKFLEFFVQHMVATGGEEAGRRNAFLPTVIKDEKGIATGEVEWPGDIKRNLFLMSYDIAEHFEQSQINTIIDAHAATGNPADVAQAKKDKDDLKKGKLMLVKDSATGDFTSFIRFEDLKPGDTAVAFLPTRTPTARSYGDVPSPSGGGPDQTSSFDELSNNFNIKRGKSIADRLQKLGFTMVGEVQFDGDGKTANHAYFKVKSGEDTLLVTADIRALPNEDLKLTFAFQGAPGGRAGASAGAAPAAGATFTMAESKLDAAFTKADGALRTARELFNDLDLCRALDVGRSGFVQKAPGIVAAPLVPGAVPQGGQLGALIPSALPGALAGGPPPAAPLFPSGIRPTAERTGFTLTLPTGTKAPQMPQVQAQPGVPTTPTRREIIPGIPDGTVMAAKEKARRAREEAESRGAQPSAFAPGQPPTAPGRVGGTTIAQAAPPPKSHLGRNVILANVLGITIPIGGSFLGGAFLSGTQANSTQTLYALKAFFIAFSAHIQHLFG